MFDDQIPLPLAFLAFREVEFGHQLLQTLQGDGFAVAIVVFDDVLLELRVFGHNLPSWAGESARIPLAESPGL